VFDWSLGLGLLGLDPKVLTAPAALALWTLLALGCPLARTEINTI
jgi:hypothetical protein